MLEHSNRGKQSIGLDLTKPDGLKILYKLAETWARAGVAMGAKPPGSEFVPSPPAPAFGDSIGAMTIAGGIMGALFHRERTGEASEVDVSLFGTGLWSMGAAMALSLALDTPWYAPPASRVGRNPLINNYATSDGHWIALTCLQAGKYWAETCEVVGRPESMNAPVSPRLRC